MHTIEQSTFKIVPGQNVVQNSVHLIFQNIQQDSESMTAPGRGLGGGDIEPNATSLRARLQHADTSPGDAVVKKQPVRTDLR